MAEGHLIAPPLLSADGWPYASSRPVDAEDPGRFHALFGRDSLITSLAVIGVQPGVARATLRVLAKLQGSTLDPETDEEPGKIVHEFRPNPEPRFVEMGWPVRDGVLRYYGSADGTAWFLIVPRRPRRRSADRGAGRCLARGERLARASAAQGGGLVRHGPRLSTGGLVQQGWRDATDPHASPTAAWR